MLTSLGSCIVDLSVVGPFVAMVVIVDVIRCPQFNAWPENARSGDVVCSGTYLRLLRVTNSNVALQQPRDGLFLECSDRRLCEVGCAAMTCRRNASSHTNDIYSDISSVNARTPVFASLIIRHSINAD
jgi:hypothetical protein